ncbi:MAG: hypothetical protein WCY77_08840 [Weeksellaceae bacterium]|jgi:hypothetical protein
MKFTSKIIFALVLLVLGMILVIFGALLKINDYSDGFIAGNNFIVLGMGIELLSIFIISGEIFKKPKS